VSRKVYYVWFTLTAGNVVIGPSTLSLSIKLYTVRKGLKRTPVERWLSSSSSSSSVPGQFDVYQARANVLGPFVLYQVEAEENESVWGLKERIQLLTGISMEEQRLFIRGKVREDELTLKQHGLVGGETILLGEYGYHLANGLSSIFPILAVKENEMPLAEESEEPFPDLSDSENEQEQERAHPTSDASETEVRTAVDHEDREGNIVPDEKPPKHGAEEEDLPQIKERLPESTEGSSSQGDHQ
jgi:hypothetical protein